MKPFARILFAAAALVAGCMLIDAGARAAVPEPAPVVLVVEPAEPAPAPDAPKETK